MRKRLMNISKRCMVAIMSAAFIMSSVTVSMAFPVGVYAEELPNNPLGTTKDAINSSDTMEYNYGTVRSNDGTISNNIGKVEANNGYMNNGISNNEGEVEANFGEIRSNTGLVDTNNGLVRINYGTISHNQGYILNDFDGTVTNEGEGYIINQYHSVTLTNDSNITAEYGGGFTEPILVDNQGNRKQFIQVKRDRRDLGNDASGQITISPKENYKITGNDTEEVTQSPDNTFNYELREDGGKYYLTIINPTQALTIDPTTLGLVISRIQNEENVVISQVVVNTSDNTDDSSNDGDQSDSTSNVSASENTTNRILNGMNSNSKQNVFELDYTKQSNLTWEDFEKLCRIRSDVQKNCSFICDGKLYVLQIPAIDPNTAAFKACLAKLQREENGLAGPLTMAQIFKDQGVTCTEIKPQIASATGIAATAAVAPASDFGAFTAKQNAQINAMLQQIAESVASGRLDLLQAMTQSGFDLNIANYSTLDAQTCKLLGQVLYAGVPVKVDYIQGGISYRTTIPADGKSSLSLLAADGVVTVEELMGTFETKTM